MVTNKDLPGTFFIRKIELIHCRNAEALVWLLSNSLISVSVAAYCCFFFLSFFLFLRGGRYRCLFRDLPYPVANQLYCFCLWYIVLWFAANKFDLIWFDLTLINSCSFVHCVTTTDIISFLFVVRLLADVWTWMHTVIRDKYTAVIVNKMLSYRRETALQGAL